MYAHVYMFIVDWGKPWLQPKSCSPGQARSKVIPPRLGKDEDVIRCQGIVVGWCSMWFLACFVRIGSKQQVAPAPTNKAWVFVLAVALRETGTQRGHKQRWVTVSDGESVESSRFTRTDSPKLAGRLRRGAVCSGGSCSPSAEAPPACKAGEHKGIHTSNMLCFFFFWMVVTPAPFQIPKGPWHAAVHTSFFRLIDPYLFKQASACQPPTREICCIGPGIMDSREKELYIMLDIMYIYICIHISKYVYVYFEGLHENHVMLTSFALTRMVGAARSQPKFLRKSGPNFQNTGLEIEPRLRRKSVPNLGRSWRESSLQPFGCKLVRLQLGQIQVASTAIHLHLLHGHCPRSRPDQIQNPKSKLQTARLDFGFWILDFGFWILDFGFWISDFGFWILDFGFWILDFGFRILEFGFWILDQFSLRSFCGGPKRPRLDFGFWILG